MTVKERWTVYPLLLLAIGLALRAGTDRPSASSGDILKAFKAQIENLEVGLIVADGVFCRELAVFENAESGEQILIHAGRVEGGGGGRIEIRDSEGNDSMAIGTSAESDEGSVEFFSPDGLSLGKLGPKKPAEPATTRPATKAAD